MASHIGERLADDEVGRGLDRGGEPLIREAADGDLDGRAASDVGERRAEPIPGQAAGMYAASKVAKLYRRIFKRRDRLIEDLRGAIGPAREDRSGAGQLGTEGDQALLRTVVQIALQPLALGDGGFGYAPPRREQLTFRAAPLGEIAHVAGEDWAPRYGNPGDRQLDREGRTVL